MKTRLCVADVGDDLVLQEGCELGGVLGAAGRAEPAPLADKDGLTLRAQRVGTWQAERGASHEHATLREVLAELENPGAEVRRLLAAPSAAALAEDETPEGRWLPEMARKLLGG